MSTNVDRLAKDIEYVYENKCLRKAEETLNNKCLSLDEQELAIIHMCIEGLNEKDGIKIDNYFSKGLFVLLKNRNLGKNVCEYNRVKNQPLKFKRSGSAIGFHLENMSNLLLVYYAILLLYANDENTGDDYLGETNRYYFKIYAYFACICPKTFSILFFNQIHLFMSKAHEHLSISELKCYLMQTKELWKGYNYLLTSENRIKILGELISCFSEFMSQDKNLLYNSMIQLQNLSEDGFLAFDFRSSDTLRGYRFKTILVGIEYFQWYLKYLREETSKGSFKDEELLELIDDIIKETETLKVIFDNFLEKEKSQLSQFEREFDDIYGLLNKFHDYYETEPSG